LTKHKKIILCLDGTWNNTYAEALRDDGSKLIKPSNVLKVARGLKTICDDGCVQLVHYDYGVGALPAYVGLPNKLLHLTDKYLGGVFGAGFEANIEEAITFLVNNFIEGDEVFIFGFSRGAATARALTNFIDWLGGLPTKKDAFYIPKLLRLYIEYEGSEPSNIFIEEINSALSEQTPNRSLINFTPVKFKFMGLWDTVLALKPRNSRKKYHIGTKPAACVDNANHALATDESRSDFQPEIWESTHPNQKVKQYWFPGVHSNIGGGYAKDGLANIALKWVLNDAESFGLEFDTSYIRYFKPYYQDLLVDSNTSRYRVLDKLRTKSGKRVIKSNNHLPDIHYSIVKRTCAIPDDEHPNLKEYTPKNIKKYFQSFSIEELKDILNDLCLRDYRKSASKKEIDRFTVFVFN